MLTLRSLLGVAVATALASLTMIASPAFGAGYWAPDNKPLHVTQGGYIQGRAFGFHEIDNTANGTRSHGEVRLYDDKPGGSGVYIEMQTWVNAGLCFAPTYTSCTASFYQGPRDQSDRWRKDKWSPYGETLATTSLPASADYARGRVKVCEDQKHSGDPCSGWAVSRGSKY